MRLRVKEVVPFFKDVLGDWSEDKAARLGAALAYYTVFSLAPLLVISIAIAGLVLGDEAARGQIQAQISGLVGQEGARAVEEMVEGASRPSSGVIALVAGFAMLLFGASGVFGQLQDALNTIWEVQPKPGRGLLGMLKDRFLSFTMVLGTGFLLLVSLVLSAALTALGEMMGGAIPTLEFLAPVLHALVSFVVVTGLFALIFKVIPDAEVQWRDVWIGAAFTALLFVIGKVLLGIYLGRGSFGSTYGAAGSVLVILLWVYYAAQILFLGAEFTQVWANRYGSRVQPDEDAIAVDEVVRAQQGMPRREATARAARQSS